MSSQLQKVVLIGRVNVGKSTLFNRLANENRSLALDYPGLTRDFVADRVDWKGKYFELIDSGGLMLHNPKGDFARLVNDQVLGLIAQAKVVVLVCDGTVGIHPEDRELAKKLHKLGKHVIVAVNKIDTKQAQENLAEFTRLGFEQVISISAQHGTGSGDVLDAIAAALSESLPADGTPEFRVTLLGKPNVGKSSLMNLLLGRERTIVSEVAGTTREAIKDQLRFYQQELQIIDTAGVRRRRSVVEEVETLMVKSTMSAVRESNIVLLLVDSSEGQLSDQELKLAFYVFAQGKALIILFNKQDLTTEESVADFNYHLSEYNYFMKKVESLKISCKTGRNIGKILPLVQEVWQRYTMRIPDIELNDLFRTALESKPLFRNERKLVLRKARQILTAPITIELYVTEPHFFGPSQLAFFENLLRSRYNLRSVPVKLVARRG